MSEEINKRLVKSMQPKFKQNERNDSVSSLGEVKRMKDIRELRQATKTGKTIDPDPIMSVGRLIVRNHSDFQEKTVKLIDDRVKGRGLKEAVRDSFPEFKDYLQSVKENYRVRLDKRSKEDFDAGANCRKMFSAVKNELIERKLKLKRNVQETIDKMKRDKR